MLCGWPSTGHAQTDSAPAEVAAPFPVASDVRIAGDDKQTRFILDLDRHEVVSLRGAQGYDYHSGADR